MMAPAPEGRALRGGVGVLIAALILGPIAAGLWESARAALGILPALGAAGPSAAPLKALAAEPGILRAALLSLWTGGAATALSVAIALGAAGAAAGRIGAGAQARLVVPFLAIPHAALAIGLAFVLAPSGWIARIVAPLAGWARPPDIATVGDPAGLALIAGLVIKEVPFLLLVTFAALTQIPFARSMAAGRALGYGRAAVWWRVIVPALWPLIRLPVLVVLAYGVSVVDMALILGPTTPPTLAVLVMRLYADPEAGRILTGAAGAMAQLGLVVVAAAGLWLAERALRRIGLRTLRAGGRGGAGGAGLAALALGAGVMGALGVAALMALGLWSVAWRWPWPAPLPEAFSLSAWATPGAGQALGTTLALAGGSVAAALVLAIAWLEAEDRGRIGRARWAEGIVYLPLLVPQIAVLYGLSVQFIRAGVPPGLWAVGWAHLLFVFPYVMIALSGPWRRRDLRLDRAAVALGAGPWRRLIALKLPVHAVPILTAAAIGVGVSVAQYLPTLLIGAGRVATLTTEAVTLSSGSDRRVVAVHATLQAGVPLAAYLAAFAAAAAQGRNRRALRGGIAG